MLLLPYQDRRVDHIETQLWVHLQGFDAGSYVVSLDIQRLHRPRWPVRNILLPTPSSYSIASFSPHFFRCGILPLP